MNGGFSLEVSDNQDILFLRFSARNTVSVETERFSGNNPTEIRQRLHEVKGCTTCGTSRNQMKLRPEEQQASA